MAGTFDFCPTSHVPTEAPPEPLQGVSMNGWTFTARPSIPYQPTFTLKLFGMRWILQSSGLYDAVTDPTHNARRLQVFYKQNLTWDPFLYYHPHLGALTCRFAEPVNIPPAETSANGYIQPFDVKLVHHNPGY